MPTLWMKYMDERLLCSKQTVNCMRHWMVECIQLVRQMRQKENKLWFHGTCNIITHQVCPIEGSIGVRDAMRALLKEKPAQRNGDIRLVRRADRLPGQNRANDSRWARGQDVASICKQKTLHECLFHAEFPHWWVSDMRDNKHLWSIRNNICLHESQLLTWKKRLFQGTLGVSFSVFSCIP